jgi:hypothetical protein
MARSREESTMRHSLVRAFALGGLLVTLAAVAACADGGSPQGAGGAPSSSAREARVRIQASKL